MYVSVYYCVNKSVIVDLISHAIAPIHPLLRQDSANQFAKSLEDAYFAATRDNRASSDSVETAAGATAVSRSLTRPVSRL